MSNSLSDSDVSAIWLAIAKTTDPILAGLWESGVVPIFYPPVETMRWVVDNQRCLHCDVVGAWSVVGGVAVCGACRK